MGGDTEIKRSEFLIHLPISSYLHLPLLALFEPRLLVHSE